MRHCLLCLLAVVTTTTLGSKYYQAESDYYNEEEDFSYEESGPCLDCHIVGEADEGLQVRKRSSRGRFNENAVLKSRWTPEATVLRLLRLCQQAELVEHGFTPNNAMLYAFTNKMKKMKQKKFQSFPNVQRRRTRPAAAAATLSAASVYNKSAATGKSLKYLKRLLLRCLLDRNLLNDDRQHKIVNKKTQFLRFGRG